MQTSFNQLKSISDSRQHVTQMKQKRLLAFRLIIGAIGLTIQLREPFFFKAQKLNPGSTMSLFKNCIILVD